MLKAEQQAVLEAKGNLIIPNFLNPEEIQHFNDFYKTISLNHTMDYGFQVSTDGAQGELNLKIDKTIKDVINAKLDAHFNNAHIQMAYYFQKNATKSVKDSPFPYPHQDWTFLDEPMYRSHYIWIPLRDVDLGTGAIAMLDGSHRFMEDNINVAPAGMMPWAFSRGYLEILQNMGVKKMKAGEALIFTNRCMHASIANIGEERLALGMSIAHKDAQRLLYFLKPEEPTEKGYAINVYEIEDTYICTCSNNQLTAMYQEGKVPEGIKLRETIYYKLPEFSQETIIQMIENNPEKNASAELQEFLKDLAV